MTYFLQSGDIGYYDDSQHLFVADRLKDVIKYKDKQVNNVICIEYKGPVSKIWNLTVS